MFFMNLIHIKKETTNLDVTLRWGVEALKTIIFQFKTI